MTKRAPGDACECCAKCAQLLRHHVFTKRGLREPDHAVLADLLFPYRVPAGASGPEWHAPSGRPSST